MDPSFFLVLLRKPLVVIHQNRRGGHHALKRIDQRHFLVVIYEFAEGRGGLIRTAFIINEKRKKRRYRTP